MVPTSQPHVLAAWIGPFAAFDEAHGLISLETGQQLMSVGDLNALDAPDGELAGVTESLKRPRRGPLDAGA